jgi:hypothetical protein
VVQHLVGVVLTLIELIEALLARLKLNLRKLALTIALVAVGAVIGAFVLLVATGFLLYSFYLALLPGMTAAQAALTVGLVIWLLVGGAAWLAVSRLRKP